MKLFEADAQRRADEKRLAAARGPVYQGAQTAAAGALGEASMDPTAAAAQQYGQQAALIAPGREKQTADMMRMLRAKGLLGVGNYNPGVPGAPTGALQNPHLTSMFAGQASADAKMAADAMAAAEARRTGAAGRAGMFSSIGGQQQATGLAPYARGSGVSAAGKSMLPGMIGGLGGILKDSGILSKLFSGGGGTGLFGGGTYNTPGADWGGRDDWRSESWI
jgi:hypothetical protein